MASQKLQVERALSVIPSDTIGIPEVSTRVSTGTTTATTANKLVDSAALFITGQKVSIGDIIYNTTDSTIATVEAIDSETTLSVSANIMATTEGYSIYHKETNGGVLYVGATGDLHVLTAGNDEITYKSVAVGFFPVNIKKVYATGTSATEIIANW